MTGAASAAAAEEGHPDFTGWWVLSRTEGLDEFLRALGFPWVVRKAALKFGGAGASVDVCAHAGPELRVTSLNAKASWTRAYDTRRAVAQPGADGSACAAAAWWEGEVLRSRLEGSPLGVFESWRYRRGGVMAVRTVATRPAAAGGAAAEAWWYYERSGLLEARAAAGGGRAGALRAARADQARAAAATAGDTARLRAVLLDSARWASPADEAIRPAASPQQAAAAARRAAAAGVGPGAAARRRRADLGSPTGSALSPALSASASESSLGAALAAAAAGARAGGAASPPPGGAPPEASPPHHHRRAPSGDSLSASASGAPSAAGGAPPARRPAHHHLRSPSAESVGRFSATPGGAGSPARGGGSPAPSSRAARGGGGGGGGGPPTGGEALMVYRAHEFLEASGILAVVPVATPNDTAEPQLLGLSPEQAEETAAKLRELETEMLLARAGGGAAGGGGGGCGCCGLVVSRRAAALPDHLRVWEMTLL